MSTAQPGDAKPRKRNFTMETGDFDQFDESKVVDMMAGGGRPLEVIQEALDNSVFTLLGFEYSEVEVDGEKRTTSLEYEAFMAQGVVIKVHETKDPLAPPLVACGVNGDFRWLPREVLVRIPRRFIEVLAHSVESSYKTVDIKDDEADARKKIVRKQTPSYPFAVVQDPAGERGRRWLEMMFHQGARN